MTTTAERFPAIMMPQGSTTTTTINNNTNSPTVHNNTDSGPESAVSGSRRELSASQVIVTSLLAGATAGALAKTVIAPLDYTKINFQISNRPYTFRAAFQFITTTLKVSGVLALWRGNSATMARILPYAALQFTAHEQWKRLLGVDDQIVGKKDPRLFFLAGSLAGVTSQSLTYPLDLARARMAATTHLEYKSLWQVFYKIVETEGPRALYRGYLPTVLGVIPYAGVSFFTYDSLKQWYFEYYGEKHPSFVNLIFGGIAGMLGQSSSYPLDIVRRRMQTARRDKNGRYPYENILGTLKIVYREEGIRQGFFKGLSMNWIKGPVAVGISFATNDSIRANLRILCHKYNIGKNEEDENSQR